MNFNDIMPEDYSKETFGKCIRARREELGRTVRDVAKAVGMSTWYTSSSCLKQTQLHGKLDKGIADSR